LFDDLPIKAGTSLNVTGATFYSAPGSHTWLGGSPAKEWRPSTARMASSSVASTDSSADFLPANRLVQRDIKAAYDKRGDTSLRAAVHGS
jgi:hypothetical protein